MATVSRDPDTGVAISKPSTGQGAQTKGSTSSASSGSKSKAPNAAAAAAAAKASQGKQQQPAQSAAKPAAGKTNIQTPSAASKALVTTSKTNASVSISKAPNAAAAAALAKLNAQKTSPPPSQTPSIQKMINTQSGTVTGWGGPALPKPAAAIPSQFNNQMLNYNSDRITRNNITDPAQKMDSLHNLTKFSEVGYNADGVKAIKDRLGYTPVGIRTNNPGNLLDSGWQRSMPGYTGPVRSSNGLTYASYSDPRYGLVAQNELLGRYHDAGRNTIRSVVDRYAPVDQNNSAAANAAYKQHLANATGFGLDQELSREQVQALGPYKTTFENGGRVFAGGPFGGTASAPHAQMAAARPSLASNGLTAALQNWNVPPPSRIPAPVSQGMLPPTQASGSQPPQAPSQPFMAGDPRVNRPPGSFPSAPITGAPVVSTPLPPIRSPQGPQMPPGGLSRPPMVAGDPRVGMPLGGFPAAPGMPPGKMITDRLPQDPNFVQGSGPKQITDRVPQDPRFAGNRIDPATGSVLPPPSGFPNDPRVGLAQGGFPPASSPPSQVYSDSPIQGPSNPMQEGRQVEDPKVQRDRQMTYAERGASRLRLRPTR